jgi:hypothetical protein
MKIIENMLDCLADEVEGAKEYAEKYIEQKARGDMSRANIYKEMAHDELKHASYIRDMHLQDIEKLSKVYTLPEAEETAWEHAHRRVNEQMAIVKHLLTM